MQDTGGDDPFAIFDALDRAEREASAEDGHRERDEEDDEDGKPVSSPDR